MGNVADLVGGGTPSTQNPEYWDGDIDWYAPAEIANQIYVKTSQRKITEQGYDNSSAKLLPPGTVLFTSRAGIGKTAILARKGCTNQGFQSIVPHKNELDTYFIFSRTEELKRYGELVGAGSTFVEVSGKQMAAMDLMLPSTIQEQQMIGVFFEQLDNLITLHQRKCVFLFSFFRACISMNFTASTFSWEQRKLGDVVQITMGQSPDGSTYSDEPSDYILVQGNADLQNGWVCPRIWTTQITKKADAGDLIMSVRAPAGAMGKTAYNAVIGRGVAAIKGNEFIYQLLVKMDMDGFWKTLSCGSTFESLNSDNIKNAEVKVPTTAEQVQIGDFFRQLDNLITLHQRECISFTGSAGRLILTANKKRTASSWEQRKLGELVDVCSGRDYKHLSEGTIPVYGTGGYMLSVNDALSYDRDAIGIGRKGTIDRPYILKAPFWTVDTLFYAIPREKADLNFAFDIFQNIDWKKKDESTGVPSLSKTAINDIDVLAPKHGEQQTIGQFFAAIDHLITLHQRKPFLMKWRTSDANRNQTNRLVL